MALTIEQISARVQSLRYRNSERDARILTFLLFVKEKLPKSILTSFQMV